MINKAWVFLFIVALFGVFLLVHMIYYYRFLSHPVFHCFAWETIPGQINLSSVLVLEPCPQGIGQWGFHCYQYCITVMIVLYCSHFILPGKRNVNIQQQTPSSLTSKWGEEKHTVQLCTLEEVSHRCYICPVLLPDPPTTSLSHALINYYYRLHLLFRPIYGIEKSLGSLNEGRFLKEVFWFSSF